jgi:hypothetical protein
MHPNEGGVVHIFNHTKGIVEQCRVVAQDFGEEGQCLLYGLDSKDNFVAKADEMYESYEICLQEEARKMDEEYVAYCESFDSTESILLRALYANMMGVKIPELELKAIIHRSSQIIGLDMEKALKMYVKSEKESTTIKTKKEGRANVG